MKSKLKEPITKRLKLQYNNPLSSFALKFDLRRYNMGPGCFRRRGGKCVRGARGGVGAS